MAIAGLLALGIAALVEPAKSRADDNRLSYRLKNGLQVRLVRDRKAGEVVVLLGAAAGIFEEPAGKPHLAHLVEHMLAHGAKPGTAEAKSFARWFEVNRANGETTDSMMYFDVHVPADDLTKALRLQATRLSPPTLSRDALRLEILKTLQEAEHVQQSTEVLTSKFAASAFVQAGFFGNNQIALRQRTKDYSIDEVREFSARKFRPERAVLVIAGNIDPAPVRKEIEAIFASITPTEVGPTATRPGLKLGHIAATWDLITRHLFLAWPSTQASEPDHPPLTLAAALLSAKLNSDSEVASLATSARVENESAVFYVDLPVKPGSDLAKLEGKDLDHVRRLSTSGGLAEGDVTMTRAGLLQPLGGIDLDAITLPPNVSRSLALANLELGAMRLALAWRDLPRYVKRLEAVKAPIVRKAVSRHLDPARATVVRLEPNP
jgi:predicted Zn-dependent peptidase